MINIQPRQILNKMSIQSSPNKENSTVFETKESASSEKFDMDFLSDSDDLDDPGSTTMIKSVLSSMIKRLDEGLNVKSPVLEEFISDLRMFVRLQHKQIMQDSGLVLLLQEAFTRYIAMNGISFIKEYNSICKDDKFVGYVIPLGRRHTEKIPQPALPPMAAEDLLNIDRWVEDNCKWQVLKKLNGEGSEVKKEKRLPNKFEVGQIVGAKDQERKWWMARILYVFVDPNYPYPWYYVHFEGWKDIHNEWISTPFRIKRFNPRRDFLKR